MNTSALATPQQESKLNNDEYGDRASVGRLQQRPAPGGGSASAVAAWMSGHRPLWAHHMLDLIVPLAIGLSAAIGSAVRDLRTATTWSWRAVTSMAMLVALTAGAVEQARGLRLLGAAHHAVIHADFDGSE